ncbi:hypothetical protein K1X76_06145 [bacterium]|nr:hypothetical protein [bacterium]
MPDSVITSCPQTLMDTGEPIAPPDDIEARLRQREALFRRYSPEGIAACNPPPTDEDITPTVAGIPVPKKYKSITDLPRVIRGICAYTGWNQDHNLTADEMRTWMDGTGFGEKALGHAVISYLDVADAIGSCGSSGDIFLTDCYPGIGTPKIIQTNGAEINRIDQQAIDLLSFFKERFGNSMPALGLDGSVKPDYNPNDIKPNSTISTNTPQPRPDITLVAVDGAKEKIQFYFSLCNRLATQGLPNVYLDFAGYELVGFDLAEPNKGEKRLIFNFSRIEGLGRVNATVTMTISTLSREQQWNMPEGLLRNVDLSVVGTRIPTIRDDQVILPLDDLRLIREEIDSFEND